MSERRGHTRRPEPPPLDTVAERKARIRALRATIAQARRYFRALVNERDDEHEQISDPNVRFAWRWLDRDLQRVTVDMAVLDEAIETQTVFIDTASP
jgi:hypothetical protein